MTSRGQQSEGSLNARECRCSRLPIHRHLLYELCDPWFSPRDQGVSCYSVKRICCMIFELNSQGTCISYVVPSSRCSCIEQRPYATDVPVSPVEVSYLGALSFGEYS